MSERNKTIALVGALAVILLSILGILYATVSGRTFDSYGPTLLGFAIPVVTTLLAAAGINGELGRIHTKVNGNYSTLVEENAQMREQINQILARVPEHVATQALDAAAQAHNTGSIPAVDPEGRHRA